MRKIILFNSVLICVLLFACAAKADPTAVTVDGATPLPSPTPHALLLIDTSMRAGPGREYEQTLPLERDQAVKVQGKAWGSDCTEWLFVHTLQGEAGWLPPALISPTTRLEQAAPVATPTPVAWPTPMPDACNEGLALVVITSSLSIPIEGRLWGAEPGLLLNLEPGEAAAVCIAPGQYCVELSDGQDFEYGRAVFDAQHCTCWWWGMQLSPDCHCVQDPNAYQRP